MNDEIIVTCHFLLGILLWVLFIVYNRSRGELTSNRFHYSYLVIIFGYLSLFAFLCYGFMLIWGKFGESLTTKGE